jgi:LEA14-like dessication related protein
MQPKLTVAEIKQAVHAMSESERATLRTYLVTVFDVRGRDTRVNLLPDEHDRPRLR